MTPFFLCYDMRAPEFGTRPVDLYQACLDQCEWAEAVGAQEVYFTEHHATTDGYLPSPIVMAAGAAGRTRKIDIGIKLLLLPLYDPVRAAEDLAVLDLICGGRLRLTVGAGYRSEEYDQYGVDFKRRGALMEESIEILKKAWTGEPFEHNGKTIRILPRPAQSPRPQIALGGTSVASAKRAARVADYYYPVQNELYDLYLQELDALGKPAPPGPRVQSTGTLFIHVTNSPDRDWEKVAPHAFHDMNEYARWAKTQPGAAPFEQVADFAALHATNRYRVMTPAECVEHAKSAGHLTIRPLLGGLSPDVAWESLRLIEAEVLPKLR